MWYSPISVSANNRFGREMFHVKHCNTAALFSYLFSYPLSWHLSAGGHLRYDPKL